MAPRRGKRSGKPGQGGTPPRRRSHPSHDLDEAAGLLEDLEERGPETPADRADKAGADDLAARARDWSADRLIEAFCEIAGSIAGNLDLRSLVKQILEAAMQTLGAERGLLFLGRGEDTGLVPVVALSITGEEIEEIEQVSRTILQRGQKGEVLVSADATRDPRLMDIPSVQVGEIRSVLCAPLVSRGRPIGVIYLDAPSTARTIPPRADRFLEAFAGLAAVAVENARVHGDVLRENARLRRSLESREAFQRLLSLSPRLEALRQRASVAAQVDAPILILGESGTGKEMLARAIHEAGVRSLNAFVKYDCAATPPEIMEAMLFGHVRGAFPGAHRDASGLLRAADRGVLYLDEITDLDLEVQTKLLRALDEGVVVPLGGRREHRVDVHPIAATSRDIRADVRAGRFLEELYYRISVLELRIPPLRERREDLPLLLDHFLEKHAADRDGRRKVQFSPEAVRYLQNLPWRGNVRELEGLVRRTLLLAEKPRIDVPALKALLPSPSELEAAEAVPGTWTSDVGAGQVRPFVEKERELLRDALIRTAGNKSKAARLLGLHRNTLLRRLKKLDVTID